MLARPFVPSKRSFLLVGLLLAPCVPVVGQCNLRTIFAAGTGGAVGGAVYFDLTVAAPVRLTGLDVNTSQAGRPGGVTMYVTPGSWVGQTTSPNGWIAVGVDDGTTIGAGVNLPTAVRFASPVVLTPGSYGVALVGTGAGGSLDLRYTHGLAAPQRYTNGTLTLDAGAASNVPFSGATFVPRVWNGEFHCEPATGLLASFTATPTRGASPLGVTFTDGSFTPDPGGITSWAWDFDGDGSVDSRQQNPSHTYSTCGRWDVTLTVTDAVHGASTRTHRGLVLVDPATVPTADFVLGPTAGACPLTVAFTDTSTGAPTGWAWDLDGDGTVDSTQRHPTFAYGSPGCYDVTLTVSNACGSHDQTKLAAVCCITNDACSSALPLLPGSNGPFTLRGATPSGPNWSCAFGPSDVWFTFTPPCDGTYHFETCGVARFDTTLELLGGTCANAQVLRCNDDLCGVQSGVTATLNAGMTVLLRVGGHPPALGSFGVEVGRVGSGTFTTIHTGCGTATLVASGRPDLGATISFALPSVRGTSFLGLGTTRASAALCQSPTCLLGTTFDLLFATQRLSATLPCDPVLVGATFRVQGIDLGAPAGCSAASFGVPFETTETIEATIGQ